MVILAATEEEAAPLASALQAARTSTIAAKALLVGDLAPATAGFPRRVALGITGIDKVNAAHLLTCLLQAMDPAPRLVLQTGVAGALPGEGEFVGPAVGDVVIATQEAYSDTGSSSPQGWLSAYDLRWPLAAIDGAESYGIFPMDGRLVAAALEAVTAAGARAERSPEAARGRDGLPRGFAGPCVTSSQVTGRAEEARAIADRWKAVAESMEGAAAAHICGLYDVPFLEVRGISNVVGDRDRASWQVRRAAAAACWATRAIIDRLDELRLPVGPRGQAGES